MDRGGGRLHGKREAGPRLPRARRGKGSIRGYRRARAADGAVRPREGLSYGLDLARQLHERFRENFLFHLNRAQILDKMGRREEALEQYLEIERRAAENAPRYDRLPLGRYRLSVGKRLREASREREALERYRLAASDPALSSEERAIARRRADEILEESGPR